MANKKLKGATTEPITFGLNDLAPTRRPNFEVRNAADIPGGIELFIYDDIGPEWAGMIGAQTIAAALKDRENAPVLNVRINSAGGSVPEGAAIFNQLERFRGKVVVDIDGIALSAASVIAMAGDEIRMAKNAMLMIHDPWTIAIGGADDLRKTADVIDKMRDGIAATYEGRTGMDRAKIVQMMTDETWMTADEAVAAGFATSVTGAMEVKASGDLSKFKRVPDAARALLTPRGPLVADRGEDKPSIPMKVENMNLDTFKAFAVENPTAVAPYIEQGKKAGATDARAECKTFLTAFPGKEKWAGEQFASGKTLDEAKDLRASIDGELAAADVVNKAKDAEITRLTALAGTQGPLPLNAKAPEEPKGKPDGSDPKALAAWEFDNKQTAWNTTLKKDEYVTMRSKELTGEFKALTKKAG